MFGRQADILLVCGSHVFISLRIDAMHAGAGHFEAAP